MDKTKKLMKQAILLATDSVSDSIQKTSDEEKIAKYAEAMLKLAMAWVTVRHI